MEENPPNDKVFGCVIERHLVLVRADAIDRFCSGLLCVLCALCGRRSGWNPKDRLKRINFLRVMIQALEQGIYHGGHGEHRGRNGEGFIHR